MKISNIWIDQEIANHSRVKSILENKNLKNIPFQTITSYQDYFGKFKKPYLDKRISVDLYLAKKKGAYTKEVFNSYGMPYENERHFYFHYSYNCPYECEYCFLQGYFNSPDLIWFINYEDILEEIKTIAAQSQNFIWFHAGEYSDSLVSNHITKEWDFFIPELQKIPNVKLELRTKSTHIKTLIDADFKAHKNLYVTFSLSPKSQVETFDHGTPKLIPRLRAIKQLFDNNFKVAIHLDPIILNIDHYKELILEMQSFFPLSAISYWSLGILRFPDKGYKEFIKNYPDSRIQDLSWQSRDDGKKRLSREMSQSIFEDIENLLFNSNVKRSDVYRCMEDNGANGGISTDSKALGNLFQNE